MGAGQASVETPPSGLRPKKDANLAVEKEVLSHSRTSLRLVAQGLDPTLSYFLEEKARGQERRRGQNIAATKVSTEPSLAATLQAQLLRSVSQMPGIYASAPRCLPL